MLFILIVVMLNVVYAEDLKFVQYAECHYAKCRYAECHYAEYHAAKILSTNFRKTSKRSKGSC